MVVDNGWQWLVINDVKIPVKNAECLSIYVYHS